MAKDEAAIVNALRNDAQSSIPKAAEALSTFGHDTSKGMEDGLGAHETTELANTHRLNNAGKRPAEDPIEPPKPTKASKTSSEGSGSGVPPDGDVTDAGATAGGVHSAEPGPTDPVDLVSGQLLESVIDFSLPGVLPLVLRRAYASGYAHGALLGPGWASTLDTRLLVGDDGSVRFLGDDAQCLDFGIPFGLGLGLPSYPAYGPRWALTRDASDGAWTVTNPYTGLCFRFAADGAARPVESIRDRTGNEIRVHRAEDGSPALIEHSGGYRVRVRLAGTSAGPRLAGYALETDGTQTTPLVGFEHDDAGRLVRVVDSTGAAHCYEYDAHGRVCAWTDRSGYRYPYRYDEAGRVVETGEAGGFKHALIDYDPAARVTSVTDGVGNVSRYHYNRFQQITKTIDALGAATLMHKDANGRLLEHTTPLGHTTAYAYDAEGNRTRITFPDGNIMSMTYQGPGRLTRVDLPDGGSWRYSYDERGNVLTETDPLGAVTCFAYDEHGAVVAIIDPLGAVQRYETNPAGMTVAVIDPRGGRSTISRDAQGRIAALHSADGSLGRIERDSEGRVLAETGPDGAVTRYLYDAAGNQTAVVDPSGRTTRIDYGPFYTPIARTDPDGARHAFAYDAELRLTTVTGPTGLEWSYRYDENGHRVAEHDFDGRARAYTYDADGRLTTRTEPDGQTTEYRCDDVGRLTELRTGNESSRFGYDRAGRMISAVNRHATVVITRDALGRIVREEVNGQAVASEYDVAGNLTLRVTPSGARSQWTYDQAGDATSLTAGTDTLSFARDALGREIRRELLGRLALDQAYDTAGQLTTQRLTTSGRTLQERTYSYDADGLPTRIADLLRGTRDLTLDNAGRITGIHAGDAAERYTYDAIGNITSAEITALPQPPAGAEPTADATAGQRAIAGTRVTQAGRTTYTYDARGRLIGKTRRTLSGQKLSWTYEWNAQDRLTSVTGPRDLRWSYTYDALGRRLAKTRITAEGQSAETTRFVWDGTLLVEQTAERGTAAPVTVTWDYEPDGYRPAVQRRSVGSGAASQQEFDAEFWAIVTDLAGTPQELVSRQGTIDWTQRTRLWGRPHSTGTQSDGLGAAATSVECPIGFPGQYHDHETGLYYNNQRYYDPDTAAYLSPDPVGLAAAPNPQRYVENPFTLIDPLGLTPQGPSTTPKTEEGNFVYRNLRPDEDPANGLTAKNPNATYTPAGHVLHGSKPNWKSQFISTTKSSDVALNSKWAADRTVKIDLDKYPGIVHDLTTDAGRAKAGIRGFTAINRTKSSMEVLLEGHVPSEAITWVKGGP